MRPGNDAALLTGFLNTIHLPDGMDALRWSCPADWLQDGLTGDGRSLHEGPSTCEVHGAKRRDSEPLVMLREGLRVQLVRRDDARSDPEPRRNPEIVARADAVLRSVPLILSLGGETRVPTLQPASATSEVDQLATVAAAVIRAQLDGSLSRVKVCARAWCRWAFFDTSRNRSRHWCSMAGCGNVEKNRAYRARRATP